jgi:hypothetical protein
MQCLLGFALCRNLSAQVPTKNSKVNQAQRIKEQVLQPALKLLKKARVPFDPQLLLHERWREELRPAFEQMPELTRDLHVTGSMSGLYLARTIVLPEQVKLSYDTVILARDLAPEDENSSITLTGEYRLVILIIGDPKQYQAMRKRGVAQFFHINVNAPCAFVGLPPIFLEHVQCRGMGYSAP